MNRTLWSKFQADHSGMIMDDTLTSRSLYNRYCEFCKSIGATPDSDETVWGALQAMRVYIQLTWYDKYYHLVATVLIEDDPDPHKIDPLTQRMDSELLLALSYKL